PNPSIVHQNVDTAKTLERSIGKGPGGLFIGDVADDAERFAAGGFDFPHNAFAFAFVGAHVQHDRSTSVSKRTRDGACDIASRAGHDGDLAGKFFFTHRFSPVVMTKDEHASPPRWPGHPRLYLPSTKTWRAGV